MKTVFHTYKKLILFIGMIIAVLVCNHIFGWSAMLSGTGSMNLLRQMAEENLVNAIFLYTVITVVGCVESPLLFWPDCFSDRYWEQFVVLLLP